MRIVTGSEMSAIDAKATDEFGVPPAALMERAGFEVAAAVKEIGARPVRDLRVHVVCGGGKNGGDGFVAARALGNWGARVRVFLAVPPGRLAGDSASFYRAVSKMGIPCVTVSEQDVKRLGFALKTADVVVDALVGTGLNGPLRPFHQGVAEAMNESGARVVAVDIPSGVSADTGAAAGSAVKADLTVTFGLPKVGHLFGPGKRLSGRLKVAEIGFPRPLLDSASKRTWMRREEALERLKDRPPDGHKGTFGRVVVVAGSTGMAGAAALAAKGALRAGAGLVTWAGPASLLPLVQALVPEATAAGLPEAGGRLEPEAASRLLELLKEGDVVAVGPGLGQGDGVAAFVCDFLARWPGAAVIDADALNALAARGDTIAARINKGKARIVTPHPKEASRLLGAGPEPVAADPLSRAGELAARWHAVAVLKGSPTVIAEPGGETYVNGSGNTALATGGTGDVLTGVIAGLMAQGYGAGEAAALGAFVHGRAGEFAGDELGEHGTIASDVAANVARVFAELEREKRAMQS